MQTQVGFFRSYALNDYCTHSSISAHAILSPGAEATTFDSHMGCQSLKRFTVQFIVLCTISLNSHNCPMPATVQRCSISHLAVISRVSSPAFNWPPRTNRFKFQPRPSLGSLPHPSIPHRVPMFHGDSRPGGTVTSHEPSHSLTSS